MVEKFSQNYDVKDELKAEQIMQELLRRNSFSDSDESDSDTEYDLDEKGSTLYGELK